ncbi:hypothetical protein FOA43_001399 [Brettanomyces nanus]|uniref:Ribophorin II C-terminal domain-containing protein n=1 Tax=Eeniella nana TaxID=13502 RepID=A0A875RZD1_EENNA|nr:uncharacterized protein FOA43_001399 [Brettanomyces nanus]QPG74078.1 hypothetical protein FOA43_001399 [Brettanomyces nanus]
MKRSSQFNGYQLLLVILVYMIGLCQGLQISNGHVRLDKVNYEFQSEPIALDVVNRNLDISFRLLQDNGESIERPGPRQISVILSSDALKAQSYLYPSYKVEADVYELKVKVKDISDYLKKQDSILVKILVGDSNSENNVLETVVELQPSQKLRDDLKMELPKRFVVKEEIHHIFHGDSKHAPKFVSQIFVIDVVVVFGGLIYFWTYFDAINVGNISKVTLMSFPFLGSLLGFEAVFYSYYLGTSIFTTLLRTVVVGILAIYFGSRVLGSLYRLRVK